MNKENECLFEQLFTDNNNPFGHISRLVCGSPVLFFVNVFNRSRIVLYSGIDVLVNMKVYFGDSFITIHPASPHFLVTVYISDLGI